MPKKANIMYYFRDHICFPYMCLGIGPGTEDHKKFRTHHGMLTVKFYILNSARIGEGSKHCLPVYLIFTMWKKEF